MKYSMFATIAAVSFIAGSAHAQDAEKLARVQALKSQIVEIATTNQSDLENLKAVRATLDPLVEELASLQDITAEESLSRKVGAWRQLWTDDSDDVKANNVFVQVDRSRTFQVVLNNGVFYNTSVINLPFGLRISAFLRGTYAPEGREINLEFTSLRARLGGITGLESSVAAAENNTLSGLVGFPGGAKRPNGPVGVKGKINTVYIDDEVRVDYGQNLDDGVQDLFVLVRLSK